jgi:prepilin-type processing-associated H-X9-DG protein/prepilin-type N-terminal cleavage/methylation domain-containing protein
MHLTREQRAGFMSVFAKPARSGSGLAFTLIELLVVMAVIAILASMLLTALSKTKMATSSISCANNLRQLQIAWHLYATDYNGDLPGNQWKKVNWQDDCPDGYQSDANSWVLGDASINKLDWGIRNGSLFPYLKATEVYHCPTDCSFVLDAEPRRLRNRSYSMSYYMNGSPYLPQRQTKLSQVRPASNVFVFLDEHENSINDGVFYVHPAGDIGEQVAGPHWMDLPAQRHGGGCNFAFADGHAARWPWKWQGRTQPDSHVENSADQQDLRLLQTGIPER